jgi:NAD(P)-dependent dehydrogenase (short-subunit alcohol dehydrogenase family)
MASNNEDIKLDGKVVVITGANAGIGYETAIALAKKNAHVTLACRDLTRAQEAANKIKEISKNQNIFIEELDLASLQSIRDFAKNFKEKSNRLDILINNAGVFMSRYSKTNEGFELHFGVNHLGHFLLTNLLLDLIKNSAPSRIINLSSDLHKSKIVVDTFIFTGS